MSYRIKIPSFNNEASQLNTLLLVSQPQGFRNQFRDTTDCGEEWFIAPAIVGKETLLLWRLMFNLGIWFIPFDPYH